MLNPQALNIYLISQNLKKDGADFKNEKWYGTEYQKYPLDENFKQVIL